VGVRGLDYLVFFVSHLQSKVQNNYTMTEYEALSMVYSMEKKLHYLLVMLFTFYVDHQALIYLLNKPIMQGRVIRWLLLL
jgi:hypothetical protein